MKGIKPALNEWNDNRQRALNEGFAKQRAKDKPAGILADGTLVNADGEPIIASEGSFGGFASDGQRFDLQEMEDGSVRLSPEAMKALDEQFGNTPAPAPENADAPQLTDEVDGGHAKAGGRRLGRIGHRRGDVAASRLRQNNPPAR